LDLPGKSVGDFSEFNLRKQLTLSAGPQTLQTLACTTGFLIFSAASSSTPFAHGRNNQCKQGNKGSVKWNFISDSF